MLKIGVIGYGAVAGYLAQALHAPDSQARLTACLIRPGRDAAARASLGPGPALLTNAAQMAAHCDLVVDCAGHDGLRAYGTSILKAGCPLITLSLGALADAALHQALSDAAREGGTYLQLASGAIGGLDALSAASLGRIESVLYIGRKPPAGWRGSAAEDQLNLDQLSGATRHFKGTARAAALRYPKNANVAAAVALSGIGFDATEVELFADPTLTQNVHRIEASGDFGALEFCIAGHSLPDNPKTSALAAMSALRQVLNNTAAIRL